MYYRPKISINGHGLLLRLREANMAMTAVFKRGIIPYHSHQESRPGVEQLRYKTSFNCTISADQLSATILGISTRIIIITCDVEDQLFILNCQTVVLNSRDTSFSFLRLHNSMRTWMVPQIASGQCVASLEAQTTSFPQFALKPVWIGLPRENNRPPMLETS